MRRLVMLVVLCSCGTGTPVKEPIVRTSPAPAPPAHVTPAPAGAPATRPAKPTGAPAKPVAEPAANTPCELDAASSECKCSQGDTAACIRLSDVEVSRRGQHDLAISRVLGMCQRGIAEACFAGAKYLTQLHIGSRLGHTPNTLRERGVALFEKSCGDDVGPSCLDYGLLLIKGKYVTADVKRGRELVERACATELPRACMVLGLMYANGDGVKKDPKRALALLEQACTAGGGAGCTALGDRLLRKDRKRALELFDRACEAPDAAACARSGEAAHARGDKARAAQQLEKACELDHVQSCVRAGTLLSDPARAREAFERACDSEIGAGCAGLAPLVATGSGGPRNFGEGIELAERACKLKTPKACELAARIRRTPPEVSCTTVDTCRPLCDEKIAKACIALAELEITADGCDAAFESLGGACHAGDSASCIKRGNLSKAHDAVSWYESACKAKVGKACVLRDAALSDDPKGADHDLAVKGLKRACNARDRAACTWYATRIARARSSEAVKLWSAACDAGEGRACRQLAWHIDTNPKWGVGDGSPDRTDSKLAARVLDLLDRGCKLGDARACRSAMDARNVDGDRAPPWRCDADIVWEWNGPEWMKPRS